MVNYTVYQRYIEKGGKHLELLIMVPIAIIKLIIDAVRLRRANEYARRHIRK